MSTGRLCPLATSSLSGAYTYFLGKKMDCLVNIKKHHEVLLYYIRYIRNIKGDILLHFRDIKHTLQVIGGVCPVAS